MTPRQAARAAGQKTYFSNKPCKRGHTGPRGVCDGACYECLLEDAKTPAGRTRQARARERNREKIRERNRAASLPVEQLEKKRLYSVKYYQATKNDPDRAAVRSRVSRGRRAREAGAFGKEDKYIRELLLELQEHKCIACECCVAEASHLDHIVPLKRGGSNLPLNFQVLCPACNISKKDKCPVDWANSIGLPALAGEFQEIVDFHQKLSGMAGRVRPLTPPVDLYAGSVA